MKQVPIPFTGQKVDITDPKEVVMTVFLLTVGFAALFLSQDMGGQLKSTVSNAVGLGSEGQAPEVL